jgi:hypothetical protein
VIMHICMKFPAFDFLRTDFLFMPSFFNMHVWSFVIDVVILALMVSIYNTLKSLIEWNST